MLLVLEWDSPRKELLSLFDQLPAPAKQTLNKTDSPAGALGAGTGLATFGPAADGGDAIVKDEFAFGETTTRLY